MSALPVSPGARPPDRLAPLASGIRRELASQGLDFASVPVLARALRADPASVRAAAVRERSLGLCGSAVFCLPPQPLAMGFRAEVRDERLILRLPVRHLPDLWITGHRLGLPARGCCRSRTRPARSAGPSPGGT